MLLRYWNKGHIGREGMQLLQQCHCSYVTILSLEIELFSVYFTSTPIVQVLALQFILLSIYTLIMAVGCPLSISS